LRNDLLQHLTSSKSVNCHFLLLLLNTQTKSLVFGKKQMAPKFYERFGPLMQSVVALAPNLEHLSLSDFIEFDSLFPDAIKTSTLNSIVKLKNLQHLNLYGYFGLDDEDLKLLARNLKNLVSLKVEILLCLEQNFNFTLYLLRRWF